MRSSLTILISEDMRGHDTRFDTSDVVFAKTAAGLYFDQFEVDLIGERAALYFTQPSLTDGGAGQKHAE